MTWCALCVDQMITYNTSDTD